MRQSRTAIVAQTNSGTRTRVRNRIEHVLQAREKLKPSYQNRQLPEALIKNIAKAAQALESTLYAKLTSQAYAQVTTTDDTLLTAIRSVVGNTKQPAAKAIYRRLQSEDQENADDLSTLMNKSSLHD